MPTYEYKCTECEEHFDIHQSIKDDTLTSLPGEDHEHQLKKVFHPVGIAFKGDGFYKNDARPSSKSSTSKANNSTADSSSSSSTSSSTESGSSSSKDSSSSSSETGSSSSNGSTSKEKKKTSSPATSTPAS